jgi:hypothetical protein
VVKATERPDGKEGLYQTMKEVFMKAIAVDYRNILVFEDDVKLVQDLDQWMPLCLEQLPKDYDLFYLGCNVPDPHKVERYSENVLRVRRALATHAVAYSRTGMDKFFDRPKKLPIDIGFADHLQPDGNCYCARPLLATQYAGYSDILKMDVDWDHVLGKRFEAHTKHLTHG